MPSEQVNQQTRAEWRELGFYYDFDRTANEWRLVGSPRGLAGFVTLLREYIAEPVNTALSEHSHYGPYMYLEIGTWSHAEITDHWIAGTLSDLQLLSDLAASALAESIPGSIVRLGRQFAPMSTTDLVLEVRDAAFDPATADPACW
jgi:hypothetical protein